MLVNWPPMPTSCVEILVVEAGAERIREALAAVERRDQPQACDLALADHVGAAERRDVAVGLQIACRQRHAAVGDAEQVGGRADLGVGGTLRRHLEAERHLVPALPEVVVRQRAHRAQRRGALVVAVVQFERCVQRQMVVHLQVDIDRVGVFARGQRRRHRPVGKLVDGEEIVLHAWQIGHDARRERGRPGSDRARRDEARADHAQPFDRALDHFQHDDAVRPALWRHHGGNGGIAALRVQRLERSAGVFHVIDTSIGAEKAIEHCFDIARRQDRVAFDAKFQQVEVARRLRRRNGGHCAEQQHDGAAQGPGGDRGGGGHDRVCLRESGGQFQRRS